MKKWSPVLINDVRNNYKLSTVLAKVDEGQAANLDVALEGHGSLGIESEEREDSRPAFKRSVELGTT